MAKDAAVVEAGTPHPSEKMFMSDHPELILPVKKEDGKAEKSTFMEGLDDAISTVVKPKEETKQPEKESKKTEQQEEAETIPSEEKPVKEESSPEEVKDDKGEEATAASEARIKEYAEKNGLTDEQAKAEIDEYESIAKKYDNDPIKIAKAYKNIQSTFDKQKSNEAQSNQAKLAAQIMAQGAEEFVARAEKANSVQWIETYKKTYPAKAEIMTDAAILEECRQYAVGQTKQKMSEYQQALAGDANAKRDEFIKGLSAEDRIYAGDISRTLKNLPDVQIIDKSFNIEDVSRWARGDKKSIDKIKKESYDRGFKAAKSGEIVGEIITKAPGGSKPKPKENRPAEEQLSTYERRMANEQYASIPTEEDRYAAYLDVKRSRKTKEK